MFPVDAVIIRSFTISTGPENLKIINREIPMKKRLCFVAVGLTAACVAVFAQEQSTAAANPITASEKGFYGVVSGEVIAAAVKMPEENYAFKPTPEVRSFGQLVGHV